MKRIFFAITILLLLPVTSLFAGSGQAKMVTMSGEARVFKKATQEWKALDSTTVLEEGDSLKTGALSNVVLELSGSRRIGTITLPEETEFYFEVFRFDPTSMRDEVLIYLGKGKVAIDLDWMRPDLRFEVKTPTAWSGTRDSKSFEVAVSPEAETSILSSSAYPSPVQQSSTQPPSTRQRTGGVYP